MVSVNCKRESNWLSIAAEAFHFQGYCLIEDVLNEEMLAQTRHALYRVREKIWGDVGREKLSSSGELGVLRLMFKYEPFFFRYLEIEEMLQLVDHLLSPTAILHLQNGFVLPSVQKRVFQNIYHRDFPRLHNGYICSINTFFAIDEFTENNGATRLIPGTQQKDSMPSELYSTKFAYDVKCAAGSMLLFDSTLVHAAGNNMSGKDRLAINQQFTRAYFKQQMDYPRALDPSVIKELPDRSQKLLGFHTRPPASLEEYYVPEEQRTYRRGQG